MPKQQRARPLFLVPRFPIPERNKVTLETILRERVRSRGSVSSQIPSEECSWNSWPSPASKQIPKFVDKFEPRRHRTESISDLTSGARIHLRAINYELSGENNVPAKILANLGVRARR